MPKMSSSVFVHLILITLVLRSSIAEGDHDWDNDYSADDYDDYGPNYSDAEDYDDYGPNFYSDAEPDLRVECSIHPKLLLCNDIWAGLENVRQVNEVIEDYLSDMKWEGDDIHFELAIFDSDASVLSSDLLRGFNVTGLLFANTYFEQFPTDFLMRMASEVTYLSLNSNDIERFDWHQFRTLPFREDLRILRLRNNAIFYMDWGTLEFFSNLEELDLSDNLLLHLPKNLFRGLNRLSTVDLSQNNLFMLEEDTFHDLPSLTNLNLASNSIHVIQTHTFTHLENLRWLNVQDNQLSTIEDMAFNEVHQPNLNHIELGGNPFNCDCDLLWLKQWLIQRDLLEESNAICALPEQEVFRKVNFCPHLFLEVTIQNLTLWE